MSPELLELLEAIASLLYSGCDVLVHEALVSACVVLCGRCDDDSQVFGL